MRQRVMIAMALACRPRLLIADEPTTALDVTVQAQILTIIRELQAELGMAVIFITHDMGVVAEMADDVVVMWKGKKVEEGAVGKIFAAPQHPYTKVLLSAVPRLGSMAGRPLPLREALTVLDGDKPRLVGETRDQDTADYSGAPLLQVRDLLVRFDIRKNFFGRATHRCSAVNHVSFDIYPGETLALVGESGSGKSTIGRTIQQLQNPVSGEVRFSGKLMSAMSRGERQRLRRDVQYIFQDPFASLDPRKTVGYSIAEPIRTHGILDNSRDITLRVGELLERVGLQPSMASRYPHEFSGGQRQRIGIARALMLDPDILIADESVSALDVSVQEQVLRLLREIQEQLKLGMIFITHDLRIAAQICDQIAVMRQGEVVEMGPPSQIFDAPQHEYTQRLIAAIPGKEWHPEHVIQNLHEESR
jgi:glutathione transport system ATP-binding protein